MNKFRLIGIALFIVAIILIGCAPDEAQIVRKTPLPEADVFTSAAVAEPKAEEKEEPVEEKQDIKEILEETIKEKEEETTKEADPRSEELLRELKYKYLIDLTTLTASNCDEKEMDLKIQLLTKRNNIENLEEDIVKGQERLLEKEKIYGRKLEAYQNATLTEDEALIKDARREMNNAKDVMDEKEEDLFDLKEKLEDTEDYIIKVEETLEKVRDECKRLRSRG
ncbi:MAG: hypothetical protein KAT43_02480 [Nanoarchaeota archaeon]|nr:hypothetical protein [Nanoarchaeota archaeon]